MRILAHIAVTFSMGLALLCTTALAVGRARSSSPVPSARPITAPLTPDDLDLGLCGDQLCLFGQIPGETLWVDAQTALAALNVNGPDMRQIAIPLGQRGEVTMYPSVDKVSLGRINIKFASDRAFPAGWIIEHYGLPCGISIYHDPKLVTLRYPFLLANIRLSQANALDIRGQVVSIQYSDPAFKPGLQLDPCVDYVTDWKVSNRGWQGFASVRHYVMHRR